MCRDFNIRTVFKSGPTLRSILTKVKVPLLTTKQSNVVHGANGSLQNLRFSPVDWVFIRRFMLGYGGFIGKASRASVFCSFRRVSSRCFVSPMYTLPQVHGTS